MPGHDGRFPTTHWTLVTKLRDGTEAEAREALETIFTNYRYPLYCFARRSGLGAHDAEDALHDFFERLIERASLRTADQNKGRLRNFLLASFQNSLTNRRRRSRALKHGAGHQHVSLDEADEARYQHEGSADSPERLYDRKWALEMLRVTLDRLKEEYARQGKEALFAVLAPILSAGGSGQGHDLATVAAGLGMEGGALRTALSRLRKRYRKLLLEEVSRTVEPDEDVADEVAYLLQLFAR